MSELFGRRKIFTTEETITRANVVDVIKNAHLVHKKNKRDIDKLYGYYKGNQDINQRTKKIRDDILNIIVENKCYEIVNFKTGYLVGEPVQYVPRKSGKDISALNEFMLAEGKETKDKELVDWMHIAGTAYRIILPSTGGDCPFNIYVPDPRQAFVVYSSDISKRPVLGVYITLGADKTEIFTAYTETEVFVVKQGELISAKKHYMGAIPIIEYPSSEARLGVYEPCLDIQDSINNLESNRLDSVEQFVQCLLILVNCKLPEGWTAKDVAECGLVELVSSPDNKAEIKQLCQQLDQTQTETLKASFEDAMMQICAMPTRNTSDTGSNGIAIVYRDGWQAAETFAKATEKMFKRSEMESLKLILRICRAFDAVELQASDIDIKFTRRNYDNLATKANVLVTLLNNEKVHPQVAYEFCGGFADPQNAYELGMDWYDQVRLTEQTRTLQETDSGDSAGQEQTE